MNGLGGSLAELGRLAEALRRHPVAGAEVMICPPTTLLSRAKETLAGSKIALGAQDCHPFKSGAHTGDISAEMLADSGATAVIVGHSERRIDHGETDALVAAKAEAAHGAGLTAIVCVGETESERRDGLTLKVVGRQLGGSLPQGASPTNTVIAYEPVWGIGTGLTPTSDDVAAVHGFIREQLAARLGGQAGAQLRILYGGSVKPANAAELLSVPNVDGALVGGASLKVEDFYPIIAVYGEGQTARQ
jgi:triosephosphate isomerase